MIGVALWIRRNDHARPTLSVSTVRVCEFHPNDRTLPQHSEFASEWTGFITVIPCLWRWVVMSNANEMLIADPLH